MSSSQANNHRTMNFDSDTDGELGDSPISLISNVPRPQPFSPPQSPLDSGSTSQSIAKVLFPSFETPPVPFPSEFRSMQPPPPPSPDFESSEGQAHYRHRYPSLNGINMRGVSEASAENASHIRSTPFKVQTTQSLPQGMRLPDQGKVLMQELEEFPTSHRSFVDDLYTDLVPDSEMGEHIKALRGNRKRWPVPKDVTAESKLYAPFLKIITAIITRLVGPTTAPGVEREVVRTERTHFQHKEGHHTSPDLVVRAAGPSFEVPSDPSKKIGYSNIATFIDIKRESDFLRKDHIEQLALYCRQVFAHQPNRVFVRCLLLSEESVCLMHYDRSGIQLSPPASIHVDASTFIRLIAGLSTTNERTLGLDDNIQWTIGSDGRKEGGTLVAMGPGGIEKSYDLVEKDPVAIHVIRGRATTTWRVQDPDNKDGYIVKDSWTSADRTPEYEFLEMLTGLKGVCQKVAHQTGRGQTLDYRCSTLENSDKFCNRIASRIMMPAYGKEIQNFTSVFEFLVAMRDAIAAYVKVYSQGIVHRDISNRNVLLGKEGAGEHERGILIDFNMALNYKIAGALTSREARTGTRFFQSLTILDYLTDISDDPPPAHDYLDDLESFFYLVCFIMLQYRADGTQRLATDKARTIVEGWDSEDVKTAMSRKMMLSDPVRRHKRIAMRHIRVEWGTACETLFKRYLEWVRGIQEEKAKLVEEGPKFNPRTSKQESIFAPLFRSSALRHYNEVLSIFDNAIAEIVTAESGANGSKRQASPPPEAPEAKRPAV